MCVKCKKVFTSKTEANIHIGRENCDLSPTKNKCLKKRARCKLCKISFESKQKLISHRHKFYFKKSHKCPHCDKSFKKRSNWQRHKKEQHGDTKPIFNCALCIYTSTRKHNIEKHMKATHFNEDNKLLRISGKNLSQTEQTKETDSNQTLRHPPQMYFDTVNTDSESNCLIFISGKTLATSKIAQSKNSIKMEDRMYIDVDFNIKGVSSKEDKFAIYGQNDCFIYKSEHPTVKSIIGFDGTIFSVKLLKYHLVCLGTDIGLYIYNTEISYGKPVFIINFDQTYSCDSFEYDCERDILYILSETGEVRKTSLKSGSSINLKNLDITIHMGCSFMVQNKDNGKILFSDKTGIWSFEEDNWTFLFKVRGLN